MKDREPDVIERMYWSYINADVVGPNAMLAAVRELVIFAREQDTPNGDTVADWLVGWIRRSEGKGE